MLLNGKEEEDIITSKQNKEVIVMYYGYARVSSKDQSLARQIAALREFGIGEEKIYSDKLSGKDFERASYQKLMRKLKAGDVLVIKSIDRLGRNYEEILEQWRVMTKLKGIDIVVMDMPLLDTRDLTGDLTGTLISDLVLQLLSYVAQTEREFIRQRQAEGIALAKERGVKFGRPNRDVPDEFHKSRKLYMEGKCTSREAAALCGLSQTTFLRWTKNK